MSRPDLDAIRERAEPATAGPWLLGYDGHTSALRYLTIHANGDRKSLPLAKVKLPLPWRNPRNDRRQESPEEAKGRRAERQADYDAAFIAAARADVPALLDYVAELEALLADRTES